MFPIQDEPLSGSKSFLYLALGTSLLLAIPAAAMQFTSEVSWGPLDFVLMGVLLGAFGSLFIVLARRLPQKYRAAIAASVVVSFIYVWAELAVGLLFA